MPPRLSHLQALLRVLRHVLGVMCGVLAVRAAVLQARCAALPGGHRHLLGMEKELRRIAWAQEMLADSDLLADAAFRGLAAERARVHADAGRQAMVRRCIHPTPLVRLSGAVPAELRLEEARCRRGSGVALALHGTFRCGGVAACTAWGNAIPAVRSARIFIERGLTAGRRCGAVCGSMLPGGRPR